MAPKSHGPNLKRLTDVVTSALGLLVLSPLGLLIALSVKLGDGGPVFFGQERMGRGGRPFRIWKFRTMVPNADRVGIAVTQGRDPRITRVGRWLRRWKLDELPQLWNVLVGEMSLVGPRPEVPRYVALYDEGQREVLRLRPGITDVASLAFRHEEELLAGADDVEGFYVRECLPRKIALNLEYQAMATWWTDAGVVLRTLGLWDFGTLGLWDGDRDGEAKSEALGVADGATLGVRAGMRVAVVGGGNAAVRMVAALQGCPGVEVVGVFDEDPRRWHRVVRGVRVVGMPECLLNAGWRERVDVVLASGPMEEGLCQGLQRLGIQVREWRAGANERRDCRTSGMQNG
ncbi:MAG: sugar transferase [Verrucomicrobiae bacterium]|nr:sugar transferase [Verrucomicrobiae bacterium]